MDEADLGRLARDAGRWAEALSGLPALEGLARDLARGAREEEGRARAAARAPQAAEEDFRGALRALAAGGDWGWRRGLLAVADGGPTLGERDAAAIRRRASPALAALAAAGEPCRGTAALLLRAGLLGLYARAAAPADAARAATLAIACEETARRAARQLLADPPPPDPGVLPLWGAALAERVWRDRMRDDYELRAAIAGAAWACTGGDTAGIEAALAEPGLLEMAMGEPWRGAVAALAGEERLGLVRARARLRDETRDTGQPLHRGPADELLERGLSPRTLRALALRRAAERPGDDPATGRGLPWQALAGSPASAWGPRLAGATPASRLRCARWLSSRPDPAWRPALALLGGLPPRMREGGLPALRHLARAAAPAGRRAAAWALVGTGDEGDTGDVLAALAASGPGDDDLARARTALEVSGGAPIARAATRAVLLALGNPQAIGGAAGIARAGNMLCYLGGHLIPETLPVAAGLLLGTGDAPAARWLVRYAPDMADMAALARAGLVPGARLGGDGALEGGGGARLRRRADGALTPAPGHRPGDPGEPALRGADLALRAAWALSLGAGS